MAAINLRIAESGYETPFSAILFLYPLILMLQRGNEGLTNRYINEQKL